MIEQDVYYYLRIAIPLRPELRFKTWPKQIPDKIDLSPYQGACYIATQVFCHLSDYGTPYCSQDRSHFWAQVGDKVWDPTWDQFDFPFDYKKGKRTKFKQMSKRAQELLKEVEHLILTQT